MLTTELDISQVNLHCALKLLSLESQLHVQGMSQGKVFDRLQ